ncbi:hypothetical protein [Aurantibacillus circumpalustris]|uniref:hypothetical protein n=1 Tax=Aurantibacillus circumpalustris TaxID=3036359 RepID=UPI00295A9693|nr:hypothetical protein [Aurantibacillus circumpalustris]
MQRVFLFSILCFLSLSVLSQNEESEKKGYKFNNNFDLALSASSNQFLGALSWTHFHAITKKKRFKIGYGIRFNVQSGKNLYYETAPAMLTSKRTDPGVLFSEIFHENIDTFYVAKSQNNSLNISINLQYTIKEKLDIGFNIDAVGFTFGGKTSGTYIAHQSSDNGSVQTSKPTSFNALLISDNDIGMLNSELYARYWIKEKWAIKAGVSFVFTEYTTDNKLRLENDRWRNKALLGMIGITYSPFR